MIIFLSELQKEHLHLLHTQSIQVLVDFCKLAIDYLNNGTNHKKYTDAAEKLQISVLAVQNVVHALVYLIVEGCKQNLSEPDFKSSVALAGFTQEKQDVLVKLYSTKKPELSDVLYLLQQKDPSYQDLLWRFEVQVASKSNIDEIKPAVVMDFVLMTPKGFVSNSDDVKKKILDMSKDNKLSPIHINSSIPDAKAASHCSSVISHVLLQCDLPNVIHLCNKLDQALKESKNQHTRKVQRALQ